MPTFLNDVLQNLDWDNGIHIPVSNEENKALEDSLNIRHKELEKLRKEVNIHNKKEKELVYHRKNIQHEHKENMHLIAIYKRQLENEFDYDHVMSSNVSKLVSDISNIDKNHKKLGKRLENTHEEIARVLKYIELLRNSIGSEQISLEEWHKALQRNEANINTINSYNKEDNTQICDLETKRQYLKQEFDRKHKLLSELCGNLSAEEKGTERLSNQVIEAMEQRKQILSAWTDAVENLRQRNREIQNIKKECQILEDFLLIRNDSVAEKDDFLNLLVLDNIEIEKEMFPMKSSLYQKIERVKQMEEHNNTTFDDVTFIKKELSHTTNSFNHLKILNEQLKKEILQKETFMAELNQKVILYKNKLKEIINSSKTMSNHIKELEDIFNSEEKYLNQIRLENERIKYNILNSQQYLSNLNDEENSHNINAKGYKLSISNLFNEENKFKKDISKLKEKLYNASYRLEMLFLRIAKLEEEPVDNISNVVMEQKFQQLNSILTDKLNFFSLLNDQRIKLDSELRLLKRNINEKKGEHHILLEQLNKLSALSDGAIHEEDIFQKDIRASRAEENILHLKLNHIKHIIKQIFNMGDSLNRIHLDLQTAVHERMVEVNEKKSFFLIQKNVLLKERGILHTKIKTEEMKLEQMRKRYYIQIHKLGKNEDGNLFSVAYFKIKYAQERSELQHEGDILDAKIKKGEQEIAALEATLQVVTFSNKQLISNLNNTKDSDPEILEYNALCETFKTKISIKTQLNSKIGLLYRDTESLQNLTAKLFQQYKEAQYKKDELIDEVTLLKRDIKEQNDKICRANELRKKSCVKTKKKIKYPEIWEIHEKDFYATCIQDSVMTASTQLNAINSQAIHKKAHEFEINLSLVSSSQSNSKKMSYSSKSSSLSSNETIYKSTIRSTKYSIINDEKYSANIIPDERKDINDSSQPLMQKIHYAEQQSTRTSSNFNPAPVHVVVLGADLTRSNDTQSNTSYGRENLESAKNISKYSISSTNSTKKKH